MNLLDNCWPVIPFIGANNPHHFFLFSPTKVKQIVAFKPYIKMNYEVSEENHDLGKYKWIFYMTTSLSS